MISNMRRHAPATLRNREPILDVLRNALPQRGRILELASGTGEHVAHFAEALPGALWQPSDSDPAALASIDAWRTHAALPNIAAPLLIDVTTDDWPIDVVDGAVCINMIHIAPWSCCCGLMRGSGRTLVPGAPLILYGPFFRKGIPTAPGNAAFDRTLRAENPEWGVRDLEDVVNAASEEGIALDKVIEMPANNLSVVFRRR